MEKAYNENEQTADGLAKSYNGGDIVPIYTSEQLAKVGTGETSYSAETGKVYTFSDDKTYMFYGESEDITDVINKIVEDKVSNFIEQKVEEKVNERNKLVVLFSSDAKSVYNGTLNDDINNYDYIIVIHGMAIDQEQQESEIVKVKKNVGATIPFHFSTSDSAIWGAYRFNANTFSTVFAVDQGGWSFCYGVMEVIGIKI